MMKNIKRFINRFKKFPSADTSGKDIARACFESYDEDIYVNTEAENFEINYEEVFNIEDEFQHNEITFLPITDENEIANRLMFGFNKYYNPKQRNNSLFKLAASFNSFGIDKITCLNYLSSFQQTDFDLDEIQRIIDSAYKNKVDFNTKKLEDKKKKQKLQNLVLSGKKFTEIKDVFKDVEAQNLEKEIENINRNVNLQSFWGFDRNGKVNVFAYRFKLYLESLKYYKYYPVENTKTFILITKRDNFINNISEYQIKDNVMKDLIDRNELTVFDAIADNSKLFTPQYLSMIDTADVKMEKDGVDYAMIYYKNCAVKVFHDFVEVFQYEELTGYIWENQIIERNFIKADHHESMFRSFVWFISGEDVERYNTMKSIIGYCLHSYKTSANNKAIILNDETISDNPNGGSGKGILINAFSHMKKVSTIDGKTFDFEKSFPYQTVSTDCQLLAFDDVKKNFDFERLFSIITEGLTIEYKGKDAIKIPVKDSPKVLISTNYTIKSEGGSFKRRMFEVELSSYFGINHTPLDEFGCMLFEDWGDSEWARFDQFMINCLQYYLENGLVVSKTKNLELRKFINSTSPEFNEWTNDGHLKHNIRIIKNEIYDEFMKEYSDLKFLNKRLFNKWVCKYAEYNKLVVEDGNSNGKRFWILKTDENSEILEEEFNNEAPF